MCVLCVCVCVVCVASELGVDETEGVRVFEKLKFSMLTDEVRQTLERDHPERKDVLLLGIEVRPSHRAVSARPWPTNLSRAPTTRHCRLMCACCRLCW